MKAKIEVSTKVVQELGCVPAVVLGLINSAIEPLSTKEIAKMIDVSFPTAKKALDALVINKEIKVSGDYDKRYTKI